MLGDPVNLIDPDGLCPLIVIPALSGLTTAELGMLAGVLGLSAAELYDIIRGYLPSHISILDVYDALNNYLNAKDSKRMSDKELDKAAKKNGYKDIHDMKDALGLGKESDIFADKNGDMYSGGTKGHNRDLDSLGHNKNGD